MSISVVTDVTKSSLLFAVSSDTCSTLVKEHVPVFSPPIDIKQALLIVQYTQSVSVPIRNPSDKERSIVTRRQTCIYIHRKYKIPGAYIRGTLILRVRTCGWRLWVVFLEHGGGALGLFISPVRTYLQSSRDLSLSASHYFSFLSKRSGRRIPPAERTALYIV